MVLIQSVFVCSTTGGDGLLSVVCHIDGDMVSGGTFFSVVFYLECDMFYLFHSWDTASAPTVSGWHPSHGTTVCPLF